MAPVDREWVGRTLFVAKGKLTSSLKLWLYPPPLEYSSSPPKPDIFHAKRLLLWLPRMLWKINFHCQRCGEHKSLRSKRLYNHVRIVKDVKDSYYVAGKYMDCRACSGTYISWDSRILGQLSDGVRARFPVLMTRKYACDQIVIALLHSRTLGNSPTALRNTLHEIQSEEWLRRQLDSLSCCLRHQKSMKALNLPIPDYPKPTPFPPFRQPNGFWLLTSETSGGWMVSLQLRLLRMGPS